MSILKSFRRILNFIKTKKSRWKVLLEAPLFLFHDEAPPCKSSNRKVTAGLFSTALTISGFSLLLQQHCWLKRDLQHVIGHLSCSFGQLLQLSLSLLLYWALPSLPLFLTQMGIRVWWQWQCTLSSNWAIHRRSVHSAAPSLLCFWTTKKRGIGPSLTIHKGASSCSV